MKVKYEILNLNSNMVHTVGQLKLDRLLFSKKIYYHHTLEKFVYYRKKRYE